MARADYPHEGQTVEVELSEEYLSQLERIAQHRELSESEVVENLILALTSE